MNDATHVACQALNSKVYVPEWYIREQNTLHFVRIDLPPLITRRLNKCEPMPTFEVDPSMAPHSEQLVRTWAAFTDIKADLSGRKLQWDTCNCVGLGKVFVSSRSAIAGNIEKN
jgi:hypothetical protein